MVGCDGANAKLYSSSMSLQIEGLRMKKIGAVRILQTGQVCVLTHTAYDGSGHFF